MLHICIPSIFIVHIGFHLHNATDNYAEIYENGHLFIALPLEVGTSWNYQAGDTVRHYRDGVCQSLTTDTDSMTSVVERFVDITTAGSTFHCAKIVRIFRSSDISNIYVAKEGIIKVERFDRYGVTVDVQLLTSKNW